jgi:hypothetical protein
VGGAPVLPDPDYDPRFSGSLTHPPRVLLGQPNFREFATPIAGTVPVWYDPSYWKEGLSARFSVGNQVRAVFRSTFVYREMLIHDAPAWTMALLALVLLQGFRRFSNNARAHMFLLIPAVAAPALYAFVYTEPRYVVGFAIVLFVALFNSVDVPRVPAATRLAGGLAIGMAGACLLLLGPAFSRAAMTLPGDILKGEKAPHLHYEVARELHALGILPGDAVGHIGHSHAAFWARSARVRIVADIYYRSPGAIPVPGQGVPLKSSQRVEWLIAPDGSLQPEVVEAFRSTGARAIIAHGLPWWVAERGWQRLGELEYFMYPLD